METPKDPRSDAALKNKADQDPQFADEMWRFRHPEKDGQKLRLIDVAAELQTRYGLSASISTLHSFYKWLGVKRDFTESRNVVHQIKEEMRRDPSITPEAIERAGVVMFATGGIQRKDSRLFTAMMKIGQGRAKLDQNEKRLDQSDAQLKMESRRLALLEAKAAKADQAKEVLATKLSPEEQNRRLREILK
jgi:hypothetical protein